MQRRWSTRALVLVATLILGGFAVVTTAPTASASAAGRLATLRAVSHQATHGLTVSTRVAHVDHDCGAPQHGSDISLPPPAGPHLGDRAYSHELAAYPPAPAPEPPIAMNGRGPPSAN